MSDKTPHELAWAAARNMFSIPDDISIIDVSEFKNVYLRTLLSDERTLVACEKTYHAHIEGRPMKSVFETLKRIAGVE